MTPTLAQALRAARAGPPDAAAGVPATTTLVVGAAGPLGASVLEALLGHRSPRGQVAALVRQPLAVALRGLQAWQLTADGAAQAVAGAPAVPPGLGLDQAWRDPPAPHWRADAAVVVFDRERSTRHGREAAFVRPQPQQLPALGRWLALAGVRRLVVVLPHAPGLLPQALRQGLASLDEQALAAIGFEQLVLVRPARAGGGASGGTGGGSGGLHGGGAGGLGQRVAALVLSQLHWMVPQREQPLRPVVVARFVRALLQALPQAGAGTRVASPELLWDWAQPGGGEPLLQAWLHGRPLPPVSPPARRW